MYTILRLLKISIFISLSGSFAQGKISTEDMKTYQELAKKVRSSAEFFVPMPGVSTSEISYSMQIDRQKQELITNEYVFENKDTMIFFWDRYFLKDESYLLINGEKIPLTCLVIKGQDNRKSKKENNNPLIPDFIIDVTLVANEYTCTGPLNPNFPWSGKKEMWNTYLHYRVIDPTIMLPTDAGLRYRWNEFEAVLKM